MPHGETAGVQQEEYGGRRTGRKEVADEHRDLFVPAVAQHDGFIHAKWQTGNKLYEI